MDNQVQSAASPIGSGTSRWESKKKPVTMMGVGNNGVVAEARDVQLDEISNKILGNYKKAAGADASAADARGDVERGNKRFKGIVKATIKQGENDAKKHKEQGMAEATAAPTAGVPAPGVAKPAIATQPATAPAQDPSQPYLDKLGARAGAAPGSNITQVTDAYQQKLLDRMGKRFGLPPGSTADQVQAAQQAYLNKNDPTAAAQYKQNMTNIDAGNTAANKPVQLAPKPAPAAAPATAAPAAAVDPSVEQKVIDDIAKGQGLPAGMTRDELMAAWKKKVTGQFAAPAATPAQPVAEGADRAVNDKGLTQHRWLQLVQTKFPTAKIVQAKMIDGPCRATLPDGRTLSWTKVDQGVAEGNGRDLTNTPRDQFISRMTPSMDANALRQKVAKIVNSPGFTADTILQIVDAGDNLSHPAGRYIQQAFYGLQYNLGKEYEDYPERVAEKLLSQFRSMLPAYRVAEGSQHHFIYEGVWDKLKQVFSKPPKYTRPTQKTGESPEDFQARVAAAYSKYQDEKNKYNNNNSANTARPQQQQSDEPPPQPSDDDYIGHGTAANELKMFIAGEKPASIVSLHDLPNWKNLIDSGKYVIKQLTAHGKPNSVIIAQPGENQRVEQLYKLVQNATDAGDRGDFRAYENSNYHRWVGKLLGYPEDKINAFIEKYFRNRTDLAKKPVYEQGVAENTGQDSKSWMAGIRQQHPDVKFIQAKMLGAPIMAMVNGKPVAQFDTKKGVAEGMGRATPKMPKARDPGHAVLAAKRSSGAGGQHTNKRRQEILQPKHQKPVTRDMDMNEDVERHLMQMRRAGYNIK
jgi:hypothetical protein